MNKRQIYMLVGALVALMLLIIAILISQIYRTTHKAVLPVIIYTPVVYPTPFPTQTPIVATQNPNEFYGNWEFIELKGTQPDGILKGNDIGWFRNVDNPSDVIHAVCNAPHSPAPTGPDPATGKMGDIFLWDPTTNIMYPVVDNPEGNIQRFWFPSR